MSKPKAARREPTKEEKEAPTLAKAAKQVTVDLEEMRALDFASEKKDVLATQPLNALERKVIASLVAYVATTQKYGLETVNALLAAQFGVADPEKLTAAHYNEVIRYLTSLQLKTAVN